MRIGSRIRQCVVAFLLIGAAPALAETLSRDSGDASGSRGGLRQVGMQTPNGQTSPVAGFLGLEILVDRKLLPKRYDGEKVYVVAPFNKDYELYFTCRASGRYEAVAYVDGLSITTGKPPAPSDAGYVIQEPGATIPGFKIDANRMARFHFGRRQDSYASHQGQPGDIGTISVRFYGERRPSPRSVGHRLTDTTGDSHILKGRQFGEPAGGENYRGASSSGVGVAAQSYASSGYGGSAAKSTVKGSLSHDMGTEYGEETRYQAPTAQFVRGDEIASLTLEYASEATLRQAGILNKPAVPVRQPTTWRPSGNGGVRKTLLRK